MARPANTENRESILTSAYDLVYKRGFKGVSMEAIADAAGVKKANLFHYYPSKAALGHALFDFATQGFQERWERKLRDAKDPVRVVSDLFEKSRSGMAAQGCLGGCLVGNLASEMSDTDEKFRERLAAHFTGWTGQLGQFFKRLQADGYFRDDFRPTAAADSIIALLEGALLMAKATRRADCLENAKTMALDFLKEARYGS